MDSERIFSLLDKALNLKAKKKGRQLPEQQQKEISETLNLTKCDGKGDVSAGNGYQYPHQARQARLPRARTCLRPDPEPDQQPVTNSLFVTVRDSVRRRQRIFTLERDAALSKIRHFRGKSEQFSIEIGCDIDAFNWIAEWVREGCREATMQADLLGRVLVTGCMLDSPELLTACLQFWRANVQLVRFAMAAHYPSLPQHLFTKLALLFHNTQLEEINCDEFLQDKLYQDFIILLYGPACHTVGHFSTIKFLKRCSRCDQELVSGQSVPCRTVLLTPNGEVRAAHTVPPDWCLSRYIQQLKDKYQHWRLVYWYLWAACHYLPCSLCSSSFPVLQFFSCYHHPGLFYQLPHSRFGCWTCCNQKFTYKPISQDASGCQFQQHSPCITSPADENIFRIFNEVSKIIAEFNKVYTPDSPRIQVSNPSLHLIPDNYLSMPKKRKSRARTWQSEGSVGWIQDVQREQEERAMKKIVAKLSKVETN